VTTRPMVSDLFHSCSRVSARRARSVSKRAPVWGHVQGRSRAEEQPADASRACVEREDRVELGGDDDQVAVGVVGELDAGRVQGLRAPRVVSGRGRAPGGLHPRVQPGRNRATATSTPPSRTRRAHARAHLGIDRAVHGPLVLQLQAGHGARRQLGVHHKACTLAGGASGQRPAALDPLRSGGGGAHSGAWARSGWCRRPPVQTNRPLCSPAAARKAGVCEPAACAHTCGSKHLRKHGLEIWQPASLVIACVIQEQPAARGGQSAVCQKAAAGQRARGAGAPSKGDTALAACRAQLTRQPVYRPTSWAGTSLASGTVLKLSCPESSEATRPAASVSRSARPSMLAHCPGMCSEVRQARGRPGEQQRVVGQVCALPRASGRGVLYLCGSLCRPQDTLVSMRPLLTTQQNVLDTGWPDLHLAVRVQMPVPPAAPPQRMFGRKPNMQLTACLAAAKRVRNVVTHSIQQLAFPCCSLGDLCWRCTCAAWGASVQACRFKP